MSDLVTTTQLLQDASTGDSTARDQLLERYLPRLRQWAHHRLPSHGRDLSETDDVVQITLLRALNRLEDFETRKPGAFLAYLRTILMNVVRDEIRRGQRHAVDLTVSASQLSADTSVVEAAVGQEVLEAYEKALAQMPEEKRAAIIMRVEFGMSFPEITEELGKTSANATRMMIVRGLTELAEAMPG